MRFLWVSAIMPSGILPRSQALNPQLITEWIKGRKEPMGEQILHLLEILNSKPKSKQK